MRCVSDRRRAWQPSESANLTTVRQTGFSLLVIRESPNPASLRFGAMYESCGWPHSCWPWFVVVALIRWMFHNLIVSMDEVGLPKGFDFLDSPLRSGPAGRPWL